MTPYHRDDWLTVWQGDCVEVMAQMEPESVHCVVTSPPYWGLRDYGVSGALGLEPTPEEYVTNMVAVFREVRRVLRADGTCWVNLGDSYATNGAGAAYGWTNGKTSERDAATIGAYKAGALPPGLKPKDLVGIPWRVAFALQADGWYLRSDIIWSKPNPMPESVTDRPTKAHEYLFLLSKSPRYYYDADAVREGYTGHPTGPNGYLGPADAVKVVPERNDDGRTVGNGSGSGRNLRSVWSIATQPYPGAHFATFPEKLVEPCVKAGTSERGVCPECGAPWRRETDVAYVKSPVHGAGSVIGRHEETGANGWDGSGMPRLNKNVTTTGWSATCRHAGEGTSDLILGPSPAPAVVLDPFAGSGTTGRVAQRLGRRAVLIDLNGEYLTQAMKRNQDIPLGLEAG